MKRIKIAMAALVLTAGLVASFAFTSAHKKFTSVDVYYTPTKCNQYIPTGVTIAGDCRDLSLSATVTFNASNWQSSTNSVSLGSGDYLAKITYSSTNFASDQDALDALSDYYTAHGLPLDNQVAATSSGNITIRRTASKF